MVSRYGSHESTSRVKNLIDTSYGRRVDVGLVRSPCWRMDRGRNYPESAGCFLVGAVGRQEWSWVVRRIQQLRRLPADGPG